MNAHDEATFDVTLLSTSASMTMHRDPEAMNRADRLRAYIERNRTLEAERDALLAVARAAAPVVVQDMDDYFEGRMTWLDDQFDLVREPLANPMVQDALKEAQ